MLTVVDAIAADDVATAWVTGAAGAADCGVLTVVDAAAEDVATALATGVAGIHDDPSRLTAPLPPGAIMRGEIFFTRRTFDTAAVVPAAAASLV